MNDPHRVQFDGEWREALVEYLYGELSAARAAELERELASDPSLRAQWEALRATSAQLDAWGLPAAAGPLSPAEARSLARAATGTAGAPSPPPARAGSPRVSRPARSGTRHLWLVGLAAGLLAFLGLAALGTRVARDGDRLTVSLTLPWAEPSAARQRDQWAESAELDAGLAAVRAEQAEEFATWSRRERERRLVLARAIDRALQEERRAVGRLVDSLGRETAREDLRTRAALADLASYFERSDDR